VHALLGTPKPAPPDPWVRKRLRATSVARGLDSSPNVRDAGIEPVDPQL
jgi:hypothetical protein